VGDEITCEVIMDALERQKTSISEGDIVLLHTGFTVPPTQTNSAEGPGLSLSGAQYLIEKKIVAVGSDTEFLEANPSAEADELWPGTIFPVQTNLIVKYGIYVMHNLNTSLLVEKGISEFMIVMGPIPTTGAVQSWINPIAIV